MILVGPSGCGKSTALRMVAGLEDFRRRLQIGDAVVNDMPPKDRDIAMVFQNYALYPHMTVRENMGFALKMAKAPEGGDQQRVREAAEMLDLERASRSQAEASSPAVSASASRWAVRSCAARRRS